MKNQEINIQSPDTCFCCFRKTDKDLPDHFRNDCFYFSGYLIDELSEPFVIKVITHDFLRNYAILIDTAYDGTCQLWNYYGEEYVVLSDNSVITRQEDNTINADAIFPY